MTLMVLVYFNYFLNIEIIIWGGKYSVGRKMGSQILLSMGLCDQFSMDRLATSQKVCFVNIILRYYNWISLVQSDPIKKHLLYYYLSFKISYKFCENMYTSADHYRKLSFSYTKLSVLVEEHK